jgi:DnaJ-class molecular chaperone
LTPLDAFNFGLDRIIRACEEKRLDPPASRMIACHYCDGKGFFGKTRDEEGSHDCDVCLGHGEMEEPEEWVNDQYWESKYDEARERREAGEAP